MEEKVTCSSKTRADKMKAGLRDKIIEIHKEYGFYLRLEDYRVNLKLHRELIRKLKKELPLPTYSEYAKMLRKKAAWVYFYDINTPNIFEYIRMCEEIPISKEAINFTNNYMALMYESLAQDLADAINGEN